MLIVESRSRRLLRIRLRNQAHPAARNTGKKHRVLTPLIRSSGMPAQTKVIVNVLSGEKPLRYTPSGWTPKTSSLGMHNFVSGSTIRTPFGARDAQVRDGVYNRPMPKAELFKRRRQIHSLFVRNSVIPPCGDLVRPNQSRVFSERLHPEPFDATT